MWQRAGDMRQCLALVINLVGVVHVFQILNFGELKLSYNRCILQNSNSPLCNYRALNFQITEHMCIIACVEHFGQVWYTLGRSN